MDEFMDSLSAKHEAKVIRSLQLLKEFGPMMGMPNVRYLEEDIYELRTKFSTNIFRTFFFHLEGNQLVLLHGFTKKQQKTPRKEIEKAKRYRADFLEQNRRGK